MSDAGKPIHSMTGYATMQGATPEGIAFNLTVKSVNHRFLDLQLRLPNECEALELPLRRAVKEQVSRGHVDLTLHMDRRARETTQTVRLNRDLLGAYVAAFQEAAHLHHLVQEPALADLLRLPGVMSSESQPEPAKAANGAALEAGVMEMLPTLLDGLNSARATEGAALASELRDSMLRLRALAEESAQLRSGAREAHFERLRTRVSELLGVSGGETQLDQRLLAEAAMLVERSDVEEELVRLHAHIESFLAMLEAGGEVGKRLDFLLQELNREANTLLSKTTGSNESGLRLTSVGLEMKAEIEKAREQVQNLE